MNKKAQFTDKVLWLFIAAIVIGVIMAFVFIISIAMPIFSGMFNDLTSDIMISAAQSGDGNLTNAVEHSIGTANRTIQTFEVISFMFIVGLFFGFIIIAFFVRTYPFLAIFWVFLIIALVLVSVVLSVMYQDMASDSNFSQYYEEWEMHSFLMNYLPHIITAIGLIGGVILFVLISKDSEVEGDVIL